MSIIRWETVSPSTMLNAAWKDCDRQMYLTRSPQNRHHRGGGSTQVRLRGLFPEPVHTRQPITTPRRAH